MGFIGFSARSQGTDRIVRIFLECQDGATGSGFGTNLDADPASVRCTYAVDVVFPQGRLPCRFGGVEGILVLKKFYKLIHSLEERAREHGNERQAILESVESLTEHLGYTRNAREFPPEAEPRLSPPLPQAGEP